MSISCLIIFLKIPGHWHTAHLGEQSPALAPADCGRGRARIPEEVPGEPSFLLGSPNEVISLHSSAGLHRAMRT